MQRHTGGAHIAAHRHASLRASQVAYPCLGDQADAVAHLEGARHRALRLEALLLVPQGRGHRVPARVSAPPPPNCYLGNYSRLPRGRIQNLKNSEFFKSVHLFGEKQMKIMQDAIQKEKDDWARKIAVDDTTFYTVNMVVKNVPLQVDRTKDILQGPAKKLALRKVRKSKLPSGKICPLESLPVNVQALEPYVEPMDSLKLREDSPDPLLNHDGTERETFNLRLHNDRMKPKYEKLVCKKKATEIQWEEKHGPLYDFDPVTEATAPVGSIKLPLVV